MSTPESNPDPMYQAHSCPGICHVEQSFDDVNQAYASVTRLFSRLPVVAGGFSPIRDNRFSAHVDVQCRAWWYQNRGEPKRKMGACVAEKIHGLGIEQDLPKRCLAVETTQQE